MEDKTFSTQEQLLILKDLTERTGYLQGPQTFQLQMWAALVSKEYTLKVDQENKVVTFEFPKLSNSKTKNCGKVLSRSVHWLLGKQWCVKVYAVKKLIFSGKRSQKFEPIPEQIYIDIKETPWRDKLNLPQ